jgi:hypothetical protein
MIRFPSRAGSRLLAGVAIVFPESCRSASPRGLARGLRTIHTIIAHAETFLRSVRSPYGALTIAMSDVAARRTPNVYGLRPTWHPVSYYTNAKERISPCRLYTFIAVVAFIPTRTPTQWGHTHGCCARKTRNVDRWESELFPVNLTEWHAIHSTAKPCALV